MSFKGERICEFSDLPVGQCAHCTGDVHAFEKSLQEPFDVSDPEMWKDDEDA